MSSDYAIRVSDVSKCYHVYEKPQHRLWQFFASRLSRLLPRGWRNSDGGRYQVRSFFRDYWSLRGISFDVRRGESIGIIGMNGAGKSTLLQIIAGILAPTSGSVSVNGRLAGLFELGSGFSPEFTGRENVFLNGAILGFTRAEIEQKFAEIEEFAGIGEFIDQPVKTYSSGMVVRLAFAVQVQLEPDILVVDEALAVGDALFQKRCYSRIEKFLAGGGTLLFVSHDQEAVRTLTDRAVLLKGGEVVCLGSSSEVVLEYRKLLHEEENRYAREVLAHLSSAADDDASPADPNHDARSLTSQMSFGDLDVEVLDVRVADGSGNRCDLFYPGDQVRLNIRYKANKDVSGLNLGIRLRNKEGVKIYSAGTFNDDLALVAKDPGARGIWHRDFKQGQEFDLEMRFACILGEGFYEIQAYVTEERALAPGHQRTLHWKDEAAFFRVSMDKFSRWYGGVCDIGAINDVRVLS